MTMNISFPNLGIELQHVGKNITILGYEIAFYGMAIGLGVLAGILIAAYEAKRTKQDPDNYYDLAMYAVILSIIGARVYYVVFSWENYKHDLLSIFNIREGGLAIYGGVITAIITTYVFAKKKGLCFGQVCDTAGLGLVLGQIIGRWGNFFNREAFGEYTDSLLAMRLPVDAVRASDITSLMREHIQIIEGVAYIQVHPTFLYESLWNLAVLLFLLYWRKHKRFEGEIFLLYLLGYGVGRLWIEGLRTDQLLLPIVGVPVSQVLSAILILVSASGIYWKYKQYKQVI